MQRKYQTKTTQRIAATALRRGRLVKNIRRNWNPLPGPEFGWQDGTGGEIRTQPHGFPHTWRVASH
jgi:hypothetical protein